MYLVFAWVFGGYLCATVLSTLRGTGYVSRHACADCGYCCWPAMRPVRRPGAVSRSRSAARSAGISRSSPPSALSWCSPWRRDDGAAAAAGCCRNARGHARLRAAGQSLLGWDLPAGVPAWLLARVLGPWLPNAAGFTLVRNTLYFGGNAVGGAIVLLAAYSLAGSALLLVFAARGRQRSPLGSQLELALATAASAVA